jgi:hypothetical protein
VIDHRTDDPIEEVLPGRPIRVNRDDDNNNNVTDCDETVIEGENELAKAIITLQANGEAFDQLTNWTISLNVLGATDVTFWDSPTKDHQIPGSWSLGDPAVRAMSWRSTGVSIWIETKDPMNLPRSFFVNAILSQTEGMIAHDSIACQAVGTWSAKDTWTMTNAIAVAASKLDTLGELAFDITGWPDDSCCLTAPGVIQAGTEIDVVPLLRILDTKTRDGVLEATRRFKYANFGVGNASDGYHESQVRMVFEQSDPPQVPPYLTTCSCMPMVLLEMAYGLVTVLRNGEFDALGFTPGVLKDSYWTDKSDTPLKDLLIGDYVRFYNNYNYYVWAGLDGMWGRENTIKVGSDLYYGWSKDGGDTLSYEGWLLKLLEEYNNVAPWSQRLRFIDEIPGYVIGKEDSAGFLNSFCC